MPSNARCTLCGDRFDVKRDSRRWKASATPVPAGSPPPKPKPIIVCTDCFLELAEAEYAV